MHIRNVEVQLQHTRKFAHIGVGGQHEAPTALPSRKYPVPILHENKWPSRPLWKSTENIADRDLIHAPPDL